MKEPVDHILRPFLPWRDATADAITECGYAANLQTAKTPDSVIARLRIRKTGSRDGKTKNAQPGPDRRQHRGYP